MTDARLLSAIRTHTSVPGARVLALADALRDRAPKDSIAAFLFYGSGLRDSADPSLMTDLYVLPRSYRAYHRGRARAAINRALPPDVSYIEVPHPAGLIRAKVSVLSLPELERRATARFENTFWGRFAQTVAIVSPADKEAETRAENAVAQCVRTFARAAEPLMPPRVSAEDFWSRALTASYRTELRSEDAEGRAASIVAGDLTRYRAVMTAIYGEPDADGLYALPDDRGPDDWAKRAAIGRPKQVMRLVRTAFTFDGAADYALAKLERHSGVRVEISARERKHPVWHAPILLRRAIKSGALK